MFIHELPYTACNIRLTEGVTVVAYKRGPIELGDLAVDLLVIGEDIAILEAIDDYDTALMRGITGTSTRMQQADYSWQEGAARVLLV